MNACENPDILRVIFFGKELINIVKIVVPIALIILGMIDFSKSVVSNDEAANKKNTILFFKRILNAVLIFAVPWLVETIIVTLGDLAEGVNITDCLQNANEAKIAELDEGIEDDNNSNNGGNNNNNNNSNNNNSNNNNSNNNNNNNSNNNNNNNSNNNNNNSNNNNNNNNNNSNNNNNNNSNNNNNNSNAKKNYTILVGDSRMVGLCSSVRVNNNTNCSIAKGNMGSSWFKSTAYPGIKNILSNHPKSYIVIYMGTNDLGAIDSATKTYAEYENKLANEYPDSEVVAVSVTPIIDSKVKSYKNVVTDQNAIKFNNTLKSKLNSNVSYCDIHDKIKNYGCNASDGVHYDPSCYNEIYKEILNCLK